MLAMIAAVGNNGVIGHNGGLAWRMKSDLMHFRRYTQGKPCVMGANTFRSLPGMLPGRDMIVVSNTILLILGAHVVPDINEAINVANGHLELGGAREIMIIGGREIYKSYWGRQDKMIITHIDCDIPGDTSFLPMTEIGSEWRGRTLSQITKSDYDDHDATIVEYTRISSAV